jgi:abnormal spindle-like microcephaly-associated protein
MVRRHSAALVIQCAWRCLVARQIVKQLRELDKEQSEKKREIDMYVTRIQALWRGFSCRKTIDLRFSSKVADLRRLSVYGHNLTNQSAFDTQQTLGARIDRSLRLLVNSTNSLGIPQIITALIDLEKVTRLSPECCMIFAREGSVNVLYNFISSCNRSVPHMDLIKYCLQIFINIAKCSKTQKCILEPTDSLQILSNLLQSYLQTNPNIFMDTCVILILLASNTLLKNYLIKTAGFCRKLQSIYGIQQRRALMKLRQQQQQKNELTSNTSNLTLSTVNFVILFEKNFFFGTFLIILN